MESESITNLVNESLTDHFNRMTKYKLEYLEIKKYNGLSKDKRTEKSEIFTIDDSSDNYFIQFNSLDRSYNIEVFGFYNNKTNVFTWSWSLPAIAWSPSPLSKKLFDFYYSKNPSDKYDTIDFFLRNMFVTSRLQLEHEEEMEILISLSEYILKETNQFKFIFPVKHYLSKDPDNYIMIYYFAKNRK